MVRSNEELFSSNNYSPVCLKITTLEMMICVSDQIYAFSMEYDKGNYKRRPDPEVVILSLHLNNQFVVSID